MDQQFAKLRMIRKRFLDENNYFIFNHLLSEIENAYIAIMKEHVLTREML